MAGERLDLAWTQIIIFQAVLVKNGLVATRDVLVIATCLSGSIWSSVI